MNIPTTQRISDRPPTLSQAQKAVGGFIQMLTLRDGSQMLMDEDGRSKNLPPNLEATMLAEQYGPVVGSVLILSGPARWLDGE